MISKSIRYGLLTGVALALGLATATLAQPAPPPPMHEHAWRDQGVQGETPADRQAHMAAHIRDVLQLQPGQEPALQAWLAALQPPPEASAQPKDEHDEAMSTPQRLDHMLAHMDRMRAHMGAVAEATKRFYAQLTAPQQKAFDALAPMMMEHMGGDHGMMGGPKMMMHMHDDDGPGMGEPPHG